MRVSKLAVAAPDEPPHAAAAHAEPAALAALQQDDADQRERDQDMDDDQDDQQHEPSIVQELGTASIRAAADGYTRAKRAVAPQAGFSRYGQPSR